jgi:baculoviral IAP repeat-containing protein 6
MITDLVKDEIEKTKQEKEQQNNDADNKKVEELYCDKMVKYRYDNMDMVNDSDYHYKSAFKEDMRKSTMKRLAREISSLMDSLPVHYSSSVFMRVDENKMNCMKVLITGPEDTPYDSGCFIFDVSIPEDYPNGPPLVHISTTGNGEVRFNPNLYKNGKVCLSLLGTWSGEVGEKWNSDTSTLLQVFVSIQSLILIEEPYFNEPSYEQSIGTPDGIERSRRYNETIRIATMKWAILDQLKRPKKGFEDVMKNHFAMKKDHILKTCEKWVDEGFTDNKETFNILFEEINKHI